MLESFKDVIQYESSKLITYKFVSAKLVDERMVNRAKKLIINKFSKFNSSYNYKHISGKISIIDLESKKCSFSYMFDYGMCAHLVRVAILEKFQLPGMEARVTLETKRREKRARDEDFADSSDEEFDKNLEEIETDNVAIPISDNVAIPIEKGPVGRHPQEQACNALVFSPEKRINGKPRGRPKGSGKSQGANNQIGLRRSQRNRK
jgi:hypothetical protein